MPTTLVLEAARRSLGRTLVLALIIAFEVAAQAPPKVPRVGYCWGVGDPGHYWTRAFIEGLRKRGWEDGHNVRVVLMAPGSINNKDFGLTETCQAHMRREDIEPAFKAMASGPRTAVIFLDSPGWGNVGAYPAEVEERLQAILRSQ